MSDPFDPRRTPDPRSPRASDAYRAGRAGGSPVPGGPLTPPPATQDPLEAMLASYAQATDIAPAPDLSRRIQARISREPARTPPRRFLMALAGLRLTQARDAFGQTAGVAFGRGRFPAIVRGQALVLVALTIAAFGGAALAGAIGVTQVVQRVQEQQVLRQDDELPSPSPFASVSPSPFASVSPSPEPSPSASPSPEPSQDAAPSDAPPTDALETEDAHPSTGPDVRSTPGPTERAGRTHDAGGSGDKATPRPTRTPRPTPKDTPRPTRTPKPTKRPTPEPTDDGQGGGGGDGGGGKTETPEPTETPNGIESGFLGGPGTSGAVVAVGTVLLVLPA